MASEEAAAFMEQVHTSVVTTFCSDGGAHSSIVVSGPYRGAVAFAVRGDTAKLRNLLRDPRCTVLNVRPEWSAYAVVEGTAELHTWDSTEPEAQRRLLGEVFTACGGGQHPDWGSTTG